MPWTSKLGNLLFAAASALWIGSAVADGPSDKPVRSAGGGTAAVPIAEGVIGRLVDAHGRPVDSAVISTTSRDRPARPVPDIAILTDAQGRFEWPLGAGTYRLAAVVHGREIAEAMVVVEPGCVASVDLFTAR